MSKFTHNGTMLINIVITGVLAICCQSAVGQTTSGIQTWLDPVSGIEFVKIAPGCLDIGTDHLLQYQLPKDITVSFTDEQPKHKVCVNGFWLGKFELTRAQWHNIMTPEADEDPQPLRPKLYLERATAEQYLAKLNAIAGNTDGEYRLPTEVEWEYSCRAGTPREAKDRLDYDTDIINNMVSVAWYHDSEDVNDPHEKEVGQLIANAWGLHDMLGNAMELVQDDYHEQGYLMHDEQNPLVHKGDSRYVIRGGSYKSQRWQVRCGARNYGVATDALPSVGMRVVKTISNQSEK